ncbi:MAG: class IV adenylate cyclase [Thermoguttaceae bacterium]
MKYEVEQKFPVARMDTLEARLADLGVEVSDPQVEVDRYFAHPARDFSKTDEALRIRHKGGANFITYKGPKIDPTTKTRHEIELPLEGGEGSNADWTQMLEALGFTVVGEVRKTRRKALITWQGRSVEGSLDEVDRLGTFAELELVVEAEGIEAAKTCIASLAEELGLAGSERRGYLQLLLDAD